MVPASLVYALGSCLAAFEASTPVRRLDAAKYRRTASECQSAWHPRFCFRVKATLLLFGQSRSPRPTPQPGGFEGPAPIRENLVAHQLAVPHGPNEGDLSVQGHAASPGGGKRAADDHDLVVGLNELPRATRMPS